MWNGANWLRSESGGGILGSGKSCLSFQKTMRNFSSTFGIGKQATQTVRLQVDSLLIPSQLQFPSVKTNETSTTNRDSQNDC